MEAPLLLAGAEEQQLDPHEAARQRRKEKRERKKEKKRKRKEKRRHKKEETDHSAMMISRLELESGGFCCTPPLTLRALEGAVTSLELPHSQLYDAAWQLVQRRATEETSPTPP